MPRCWRRCAARSFLPSSGTGRLATGSSTTAGCPSKGKHSVGVARQYCGNLGKRDNCQVAVSLSVANDQASLPIAYQLYLPQDWAADRKRRQAAGVPEDIAFATKPAIALGQIRQALADRVPVGIVLGDAGCGVETDFRVSLRRLGLSYVLGVTCSTGVWAPGTAPLPPLPYSGRGRRPTRLRRDLPAPRHRRDHRSRRLALRHHLRLGRLIPDPPPARAGQHLNPPILATLHVTHHVGPTVSPKLSATARHRIRPRARTEGGPRLRAYAARPSADLAQRPAPTESAHAPRNTPGPDLPEAPVWDPPGPDAPLPGEDPDSSPVGDPPADPPVRMKAD